MRTDQPHSFRPRNPSTADGRTTCSVCAQSADAPTHDPLQLLRQSIEYTAKQFGLKPRRSPLCSEEGCGRRAYARGKCRPHSGSKVVLSFEVDQEMAARVDRARGGVSRSAWIREVLVRELGEAAE